MSISLSINEILTIIFSDHHKIHSPSLIKKGGITLLCFSPSYSTIVPEKESQKSNQEVLVDTKGLVWILTILTLLFLLVIGSYPIHDSSQSLEVSEGRARLPAADLDSEVYFLDGDWNLTMLDSGETRLQEVPAVAWSAGAGTYSMELEVPTSAAGKAYQLFFTNTGSSCSLLVNGELMGESGTFGTTAETTRPSAKPEVFTFIPKEGWNLIEFKVSNFIHPRAGLWEHISIAPAPVLDIKYHRQLAADFFMVGSLFLVFFVNIMLAWKNRQRTSLLFFSLSVLLIAAGTLMRNSFGIYFIFPSIPYMLVKKSQFFLYYLAAAGIIQSYSKEMSKKPFNIGIRIFTWFCLLLALATALLPFSIAYYLSFLFYPLTIIAFVHIMYIRFWAVMNYVSKNSLKWGVPRLLADCALLYAIIHDSISITRGRYDLLLVSYAAFFYSIVYSYLLAENLSRGKKRTEEAKETLIRLADSEREQLHQDIQDRVSQLATRVVTLAKQSLKSSDPAEIHTELNSVAAKLNLEIQRIQEKLGPGKIEEIGLKKAIEEFADYVSESYSVAIISDIEYETANLRSSFALLLFFIVRECLVNAVNHADPTTIDISLKNRSGVLTLTISNDGVRIRNFSADLDQGHGLDIMRYRVALLGGTLKTGTADRGYFSVTAEIPEDAEA